MYVVVITYLYCCLLSWPQQLRYGLLFTNSNDLTHRFSVANSTNHVTNSGSYYIIIIIIIIIIINSNSVKFC